MSIWVVGDIHSNVMGERKQCNTSKWPEQKKLTKDDVLIQLGDFGEFWYPPTHPKYKTDSHWQNWWGSRNYTLLVVDGNHENHDLIDTLPEIEKWGGTVKVQKTKNGEFFIAKRGEIYTINGKKVFCMGGALSVDKENRTEGISWWSQEIPSYMEMDYAQSNLEKHDNYVDIICTHTMPVQMIPHFIHHTYSNDAKFKDPTAEFLGFLWDNIDFEQWHCGHFHTNQKEYRRIPFHNEHGRLTEGPDIDNNWVQCHYCIPPVCISE